MQLDANHRRQLLIWGLVVGGYCLTRLVGLLTLPLFADEAIYLRWAQLILTDPRHYLFFPLNDGKTPLFIWQLAPLVKLIADPVWAGRLLSCAGGLLQLGLIVAILRTLRVHRAGQLTGALIVIAAPFWYFHHRMVLMDGWLVVWLSLAVLAVLRLSRLRLRLPTQRHLLAWWFGVGAAAVWAGMMTKIPLLLALPPLMLLPLCLPLHRRPLVARLGLTAALIMTGLAAFGLIMLSPVAPQLISRGGDFLLPLGEVVAGRWRETVPSIPTYLQYFVAYGGWGLFVLAGIGLVQGRQRRAVAVMLVSFGLFCLPIWLLGRVVFPRYLLPAMLFLTLAAAIGGEALWQWSCQPIHTRLRRRAIWLLLGLLLAQIGFKGLLFMLPSVFDTHAIPFVSADRQQYLTTWSSGHGIRETYRYFVQWEQAHPTGELQVATEGAFGTLPDGLLLLNYRQPLRRVWIEGVGYPVRDLPQKFVQRVQPGDQVLLVINSDRLQWALAPSALRAQFCRPDQGPCLQLWDITDTYKNFKKE